MCHFCCFDCLLTVFDDWYTVGTVLTIGVPIVTGLPKLYQQCTNRKKQSKTVKTVKRQSKQQKMTIGIPLVTCLPRLYQLCANSVPIVKNSQKTVKRQK